MDESIVNNTIGSYFVTERLKAGGVAVVYKATTQDGGVVALKLLQTNWAEHEEVVQRFLREVQIMQRLKHPHIVELLDSGMYTNRPYIIMEFMPGGSLSERLKRLTQINLGGTASLLAQIGSALDFAHQRGIVHRDLKPGNILLKSDDHAALTDFGIARSLLENTMLTQLTTTGYMPGTPHYMSPEQARGDTELDSKSDQYSLAVIAYLLSTGGLPFTGTDPLVIINQHLTAVPEMPSKVNPNIPKALDNVLLKAMSKAADNRYPTVGAFAEAYVEAVKDDRKVSVFLTARQSKPRIDIGALMDPESKVFDSGAFPIAPDNTGEPFFTPSSATQPTPSENRNYFIMGGVVLALIAILALGAILFSGGGDNGSPTPTESEQLTASEISLPAGIQLERTRTAIALANITSTAQIQAAFTELALSATASPTATLTDTPTLTNTPTPTTTPTRTPTVTPSFTVTPSETVTPSPTPSLTPTPSTTPTRTPSPRPTQSTQSGSPQPPYRNDIMGLLDDLIDHTGTAGRFDCRLFTDAYEFLQDRLSADDSAFEPLRDIIEDNDSAINLIYEDCRNNRNNTQYFVDPGSLVIDMRNALTNIRRSLE
jgi:serine/threonine-protein kinase